MRSHRSLPLAAAAALGVLALAACSSHSGAATGQPASGPATASGATNSAAGPAPLAWGRCSRSYTGSYDCATLQVPLDHSKPDGKKIDIALIRTKATGTKQGSLLVNPGGPGASAVADWDFLSGQVDSTLHQHFDVVGFDPRGVGDSTAVHCVDSAGLDAFTALDFSPDNAAATAALEAGSKKLADGCVARSGDLLPFVGTKDAAKDMDNIRAALGDPKLTYLGFSYGTFLGAEYAQEFPSHVRALVLDGALDPSIPPVQATNDQSKGFQRQVDRFLADCQRRPDCGWHIHGDPHAALRALVARIDASPLPAFGGRQLHAGQAFFGIGVALYDPASWPMLADALGAAENGDGGPLLRLSDFYTDRQDNGTYRNSTEANLAINCRDYNWPATPQQFLADDASALAAAPDFGVDNLNVTLGCAYFPPADRGAPIAPLTARGAPPILVVATTGDPATPYSEGVSLAKGLSSGVLLTNVGEQHTAYGYSACTRKLADSYLVTLSVPAAGTRCSNG
ncbi:MAG TPA: alpha/beta hydrolase [Mycobacteriales bacterium]|nr:alpha/beta hydrolase [Mycobacteriales bacterium]